MSNELHFRAHNHFILMNNASVSAKNQKNIKHWFTLECMMKFMFAWHTKTTSSDQYNHFVFRRSNPIQYLEFRLRKICISIVQSLKFNFGCSCCAIPRETDSAFLVLDVVFVAYWFSFFVTPIFLLLT